MMAGAIISVLGKVHVVLLSHNLGSEGRRVLQYVQDFRHIVCEIEWREAADLS